MATIPTTPPEFAPTYKEPVMSKQPYFAVRVTVFHEGGSTTTRDYVRGNTRMGRAKFEAFAVGDLILLIAPDGPFTVSVADVGLEAVADRHEFRPYRPFCLGCRIRNGEVEGNTATPCTCTTA